MNSCQDVQSFKHIPLSILSAHSSLKIAPVRTLFEGSAVNIRGGTDVASGHRGDPILPTTPGRIDMAVGQKRVHWLNTEK